MLQTLWVLFHWDAFESIAILALPFQLFYLVWTLVANITIRLRGRIPLFWANALVGVIASLAAMKACLVALPYALDYQEYRESVRQLAVQERLQRQQDSPDVDTGPVELAGGIGGLEVMKVFMALTSYWVDSKQLREEAQPLEGRKSSQPQLMSKAVDAQPVKAPSNVIEETSDSSGW